MPSASTQTAYRFWLLPIALAVLVAAGYARRTDRALMAQTAPTQVVGWRYPTEQSWLVGETLGAIAGLAHFARTGTVAEPAAIDFQVHDVRPFAADKFTFRAQRRDGNGEEFPVEVTGHLFSPANFSGHASTWLGGINATGPDPSRRIAERLVDLRLETLHSAEADVSDALTRDPRSPDAHEDAALVVAAFGLREAAAGHSDPRRLLLRATAHLAVASALRGPSQRSVAGELAETATLVLAGRTAEAAERTAKVRSEASAAEGTWTRALHLFATTDPRELSWGSSLSLVERIAWFKAFQERNGSNRAYVLLDGLPPETRALPDWGRIRMAWPISVRDCHTFFVGGADADVREAEAASLLFLGKRLDPLALAPALNAESPVSPVGTTNGEVRVDVLDWGMVAAFLQRHLGARLSYEAACYERIFGMAAATVPAVEAQESLFGGLTLFPLEAHRWMKAKAPYERHAQAATRLVKERPELVTSHLWTILLSPPAFARAPDAPADTVWFDPPVPFGTHLSTASLYGPEFKRRPSEATFEALIRIDPYDTDLRWIYALQRFGQEPTYEQMIEAYGPALEWDLRSMATMAHLAKSDTEARQRWQKQTCDAEADYCAGLAHALAESGDEAAAADAYRKWWREGLDRVAVANGIGWLVKYERRHGREAEAWEIARDAASTYSFSGLATLAELAEETGRLDEAEENFRKIAERYRTPETLYEFYDRQIAGGQKRYESPRDALVAEVFPSSFEALTTTPSDRPQDGVILLSVEPKAEAAGFRKDDILVALDGIRIRSQPQWHIVRMRGSGPDMRVLVYRDGAYIEVRARFEDRKIPASLSTYPPVR